MPSSIWVLFVLVFVNGQPTATTVPFKSQTECEAAKDQLTKDIIKNDGDFQGNLTCFEAKIGEHHA